MDGNLIYILIFCTIALILTGSIYISKKYKITEKEKETMRMTLEVVEFLNNNYKIRYNKQIGMVIQYVNQAIELTDKVDCVDIQAKKELIKSETLKICKDNEIQVNEGVIALVDKVVLFLINNYQ